MLRGISVGEAPARLLGEELLGVDPSRLAQALEQIMSEDLLSRLRGLGADYVAPETIASTGLRVSYNPNALLLELETEASSFRDIDVFLTRSADYSGYRLIEPARYALGVDGGLLVSQSFDRGGAPDVRLHLDGFANLGGVDGVYVDFAGRVNFSASGDGEVFDRERLTLFKDDRERALRYSAGDVRLDSLPMMVAPDFLGLSVERRYGEIRPYDSTRALGRHSIMLDRPATVEVEVNGATIRRFHAPAGRINLNDIPFVDLGNDVRIYVEDETGRREIDSFTFSSRETLLAPGVSEFGLAGGALQTGAWGGGAGWSAEDFGAMGYYRQGVTRRLTLGAGVSATDDGSFSITGNAVASLPYGVGQLDAAWSRSEGEGGENRSGYALSASYDVDFTGAFHGRDQLSLRADYSSKDYANAGYGGGGREDDGLSASGAYRMALSPRGAVSFGAGYARRGDAQDVGLRLGASQSFERLTISAAFEHVLRNQGRDDETRFLISGSMPLGEDRRVRGSYATTRNRAMLEYDKRHRGGVGEYGYALQVEHSDSSAEIYGRADYIGNRFEAAASLNHVANGLDGLFDSDAPLVGELRLASGLAVADGRVGVGRRVGDGFILVAPHATLRGASLAIGDSASDRKPIVRTDGFGPMVAPINGDYNFSQVALEIEEAPLGYDFGSGLYAVQGGARVGASVVVGHDAFYSARGLAQDAEGQPIALRYGRLASLKEGGATLDLFTNSVGLFFVGGLSPGAYRMEIAGASKQIEIQAPPEGALIDLGTMILEGGP